MHQHSNYFSLGDTFPENVFKTTGERERIKRSGAKMNRGVTAKSRAGEQRASGRRLGSGLLLRRVSAESSSH